MQPTRRQALAAGTVVLASAAAGCTTDRHPRPAARTPDDALREAAVARERELVAAYTLALQALPQHSPLLAALLGDHSAHLARLVPAPAPTPTASATPPTAPTSPKPSLRALALLERDAARAHATAVVAASRELAAVLASLAACEASHAAVL